MTSEDSALTPSQLRALFDILTHAKTYAEVESFKEPEAIADYGYPFGADGESQVDRHSKSSSPLLQLLLTKLVLPMPGIRDLPPDFWNVKFKSIMKNFADVELSESYDKAALGTRKTLATAASAFHESVTRGMLGGVSADRTEYKSDSNTPAGLIAAWDHVVQEAVYGSLVDELFDYAAKSHDFENHSPALRDAIDYVMIHVATVLHRIYVSSPEGQYLLKLVESVHKLVPYSVISQTLRVGNAATMINGMMRIFLAKVSMGGLTNWMGLTKNAADGMNLMQRIIALVLDWDATDFKKSADKLKDSDDPVESKYLSAINDHLDSTREQHQAARKKQESIIQAILRSNNGSHASDISVEQHSKCLDYYAAQLSIRDREKIIQVMCRESPDFFTSMVRELVASFDPIIRTVHDHVDLRKYIAHVQKFVDDLLQTSKPKQDYNKKELSPSIEDFVLLLKRHRPWAFEYLHEFASRCPDIRDEFRHWVKGVMNVFQQQGDRAAGIANSKGPSKDGAHLTGAGSMSGHLQSIFSNLKDAQEHERVLDALDAYGKYTITLDDLSNSRLLHIMKGLQEERPDNKSGSMSGPGVYHSRWQSLLDNTLITPATPSGPLRHGRDVKDVKSRGKIGVLGNKDAADSAAITQQQGQTFPEPPDVRVVVEALGPSFKDIVADMSSR
ncbi:PX-associated-domain-containing protein [Xylariales sp. AK1849]|nr:PX-associated-domain-containing protein [Xylariales sp. AK1849]